MIGEGLPCFRVAVGQVQLRRDGIGLNIDPPARGQVLVAQVDGASDIKHRVGRAVELG